MNNHQALTKNRISGADLSIARTPDCGPLDVIVSPRFVGLCGTDIQAYRRARDQKYAANVLGHEGVGVITEVGDMVENWSPGDAVVFNPVNPFSRNDVLGRSFNGLFQEQVLIENVESTSWLIHRIPAELLNPIGVLIEPVATAIYSSEILAGRSDKSSAVVVGDGPIALINSIILRRFRFDSVLMIHGLSSRRFWAVGNGYFDQSDVLSGRSGAAARVLGRLGGEVADVAVICTPGEAVEQVTQAALAYLKPGGLISFVSDSVPSVISLSTGDVNVSDLRYRNYCGLPADGYVEEFETDGGKIVGLTGQYGASSAHIQKSIDLLVENSSTFNNLITDVVTLDEAPFLISEAVEWSLGKRIGKRPMKAVIELNQDVAAGGLW
jgi:threonine dehydrogenase-like Zn-dependent dehydrogenase